jgi:ketosteroid isomerase-like protein
MTKTGKFNPLQHSMWAPFLELIRPRKRTEELEKRVRILEEEAAVKEVLNRYTYAYDASDIDVLMSVFHPDCVIVNPRGTYRGAELIRRNYDYMLPTRRFSFHCVTNVTVRIEESERDAGMSAYYQDVSFLPSGGMKATGGSYVSRLLKTDDNWKFIEARFTNNFQHRLAADSASDAAASLAPTDAAPAPSAPDNTREWIGANSLA